MILHRALKVVQHLKSRLKHNRRRAIMLAMASLIIFSLGALARSLFSERPAEIVSNFIEATPEPPRYVNRLTGVASLTSPTSTRIIGVMIDNHPAARPPSGLSQAPVVYEVPVEGGITRFLALFEEGAEVKEVGPVRSARPYYIDWLQEYGPALYMHSGGSPAALARLRQGGEVTNGDEFANGEFFWRSRDRFAPHNLYTRSALWTPLMTKRWRATLPTTENWDGWLFGSLFPASSTTASAVVLPYGHNYHVGWKYDAAQGDYVRTVNGNAHTDQDGSVIFAANIIIQSAEITIIDDVGRRRIGTVGEGALLLFTRGHIVSGRWRKPALAARTRWYAADGSEIPLAPGKTWIQVIPESVEPIVTY